MDVVKLDSGYISGTVLGEPDKPVHVYRGIPYAAPPVGDLRWKPPQPVVPWKGIRECTAYGDAAPQEPPGPPFAQEARSEDCLTLNVLTPAGKAAERLPVMVWLHGGGYFSGCANNQLYSSVALARRGVVLVGVNHRLGLIGLMADPLLTSESPHGSSGNYMLLDIIASLKWVQSNIAAFGGDPHNVTIFGESGGGGKVTCTMASPLAEGLLHRAICQSGTVMQGGIMGGKSRADLESLGEKLFQRLGVADDSDPVKAARAIPWQKLLEAEKTLAAEIGGGRMPFSLWDISADGWVLPDTPPNLFKAGKHNAVPLMVGANLGELTGPGMVVMPQVIPAYVTQLRSNTSVGSRGYAYIFDHVPEGWRRRGINAHHGLELNYLFDLADVNDWRGIFPGKTRPDPELGDADRRVADAMMAAWVRFATAGAPGIPGTFDWPAWDGQNDQYLYITEKPEVRSGFSKVGQK
jgi:para-nitrobenzyl esterase